MKQDKSRRVLRCFYLANFPAVPLSASQLIELSREPRGSPAWKPSGSGFARAVTKHTYELLLSFPRIVAAPAREKTISESILSLTAQQSNLIASERRTSTTRRGQGRTIIGAVLAC